MSVLPIQNVRFTKSKMSVLQNPKCQFYQIHNVGFTDPKCQFYKIQNVSFTKSKMSVKTRMKKDAKEKDGMKGFHSFFSLLRLIGSMQNLEAGISLCRPKKSESGLELGTKLYKNRFVEDFSIKYESKPQQEAPAFMVDSNSD